jgi:hypothetical protein
MFLVNESQRKRKKYYKLCSHGFGRQSFKLILVTANYLGYSPEEMKGRYLFEFVEEKSRNLLEQKLQGTEKSEDQCKFSFDHNNGSKVHCLVTLKRIW